MIIVSQYGAFHGRHGAEAADEVNILQKFVTTHPRYSKLPAQKINNLSYNLNLFPKVLGKLGQVTGLKSFKHQQRRWLEIGKTLFDNIAAKTINQHTTIFHAYSAFQDASWDRCDALGVNKVIDWGIAHPAYLNNLLLNEAKYWKLPTPPLANTSKIIEELLRADRIVIPSNFVKRTFEANGFPSEKLFLNPYGVSLSHFKEKPRVKPLNAPIRIAFAGALSLRKGVIYLLQAVRLLKQRNIPCELYLFAGDWQDSIKEIAQKYFDCIDYHGGVAHHRLADYYSDIDVFVLPSLGEGMARVVIEAMACGLPSIVTPNCGYEGIICDGKNGFEVPIRDSESIADRIQQMYEQPEYLKELSANAVDTTHQNTWNNYKNGLQKLYREITVT